MVGFAEVDGHVPAAEQRGQPEDMVGMSVGEEDRDGGESFGGGELGELGSGVVAGVDEDAVALPLGPDGVAVDIEEFGARREDIHGQSLTRGDVVVMLG